jgi:hypothetical protein
MSQAYRGAIGRTRTTTVHVTDARGALVAVQVHTSIDVATDPELADRLRGGTLNTVAADGPPIRLAIPVVYHDGNAEQLVLVLDDAHRHRELDERIAVLEQLRADVAPVPAYAKDFAVVFGGDGLRAHLEHQVQARRAAAEVAALRAELEHLKARADTTDRFTPTADVAIPDAPADASDSGGVTGVEAGERIEEISGLVELRPTHDQLTTKVTELPRKLADASTPDLAPGFHLDRGGVRLVAVAGDQLARELSGALDVRVVLHRMPSYPVVVLLLGAPTALRAPEPGALVMVPLDLANERDRGVLYALGRSFELTVELVTRGRRARRRRLTAPLADNISYLIGAADDHLRAISADGEADYARARDTVLGAGFDVLGVEHPEHAEFRDDRLAQTATASQVRRALAMARRFTRPAREDYLVCTRGYPLVRWHQLRRSALARAVAWGLWMGPELADIAVAEGLARTRRELVGQLERGFEHLRHDPGAFDLDAEAAADNAAALVGEAHVQGLERGRGDPAGRPRAIASDRAASVSGSIGGRPRSPDALIAQLAADDPAARVDAALALCQLDRPDPRVARAVVEAALAMSRGDAVRVLARVTRLGAAAKPALLEGLASSKAYVRHGCALALALLHADDATQAVIELLFGEPTELWREIARAVGRVGTPALIPLASQVGALGEGGAALHDRAAWAMAHIGARGGSPALATMAAGQSIVAPIATKALALVALAADDRLRDPDGAPGDRDVTVNHAFSRQFFDAIEQDLPGRARSEDIARDGSTALDP